MRGARRWPEGAAGTGAAGGWAHGRSEACEKAPGGGRGLFCVSEGAGPQGRRYSHSCSSGISGMSAGGIG